MPPKISAPPRQRKISKPKHPHRDYYYAKWDVRGFLSKSDQPKTELARRMGMSDSALHLYSNRGESPLMAYKALVSMLDPSAAEHLEKKLVVRKGRAPSLLPPETLALSHQYDKLRVGHRLALEDGGWMTIVDTMPEPPQPEPVPAPAAPEPAVTAAPAPEEPSVLAHIAPSSVETQTLLIPTPYGDIKVEVPVTRRTDESDDLLLALAMRLKAERDDAYREITGLRKQLQAEQTRAMQVNEQLNAAREEVRVYEELMTEQSQPQREKAVAVVTTQEHITRAEQTIRAKAPSLMEEFSRLPKQRAR